jgi:asparagine synthase (glutamine-hydrolysing)
VARLCLSRTANAVRDANLTYLSGAKLRNIEWALRHVKRHGIPGNFIETGVALGGSAIVIAKHLDSTRQFHGYDVFGVIPAPSDHDPPEVHERYATITAGCSEGIGGETYYGYRPDLYSQVVSSFASFGVPVDGTRVQLHRGLFEDTLMPEWPTAFAHIDCDWYEAVNLSLERVYPYLQPGGFLISDDYYDYGGATRAVDEFLSAHNDLVIVPRRLKGSLVISRKPS